MSAITWDQVGSRVFENGVDRGVLYLPDGSGVAWNGLTTVVEKFGSEVESVFFDGSKINDLVKLGTFSASMKAITYPDEFLDLEGLVEFKRGAYLADQRIKTFGLCYRTLIGNDVDAIAGYKLHIVYNLTAIPTDSTYASLSDDPTLVEFEWDLTAVPVESSGFRPTAHMVLDSRKMDPWLLQEIEDILYGSSDGDAILIPIDDLIEHLESWFRLKIVDHGDGTWSAIEHIDGTNIRYTWEFGFFEIIECNAIYLDDVTFLISNTDDITDIPQIDITNFGDGTWNATTGHDNLIVVDDTGMFSIHNANAVFIDEYTYKLDDTLV
jgi:hypothetical protein